VALSFLHSQAIEAYVQQLGAEAGAGTDVLGVQSALKVLKMVSQLEEEEEEGLQGGGAEGEAREKQEGMTAEAWSALVESMPLAPWLGVAPQLLARVSSSSSSSGSWLLPLAGRLVLAAPHELSWSVVVGRQEAEAKEGPASEAAPKGTRAAALRATRERFGVLEARLGESHPVLLGEVRGFVGEMQRLSLLWEERWVELVLERWPGLAVRLRGLGREAARLARNPTLSEEEKGRIAVQRYVAVLMPLAVEAEALARETVGSAAGALTPHDEEFRGRFGGVVEEMLALLRAPPALEAAMAPLAHVWPRLEAMRSRLAGALAKRGARLALTDVAPGLTAMLARARCLRVPGIGHGTFWNAGPATAREVRVVGAAPEVEVLRTKTRPKRLVLLGSDGARYGYLLKGREDLHLDQRVMQLLAAANALLAREQGQRWAAACLRARHYAVIPLSSRAGLVQWVDGVLPLFALYRAWCARVARGKRIIAAQVSHGTPWGGRSLVGHTFWRELRSASCCTQALAMLYAIAALSHQRSFVR
jgi:PI-3-kinase-related kinase SMG-1